MAQTYPAPLPVQRVPACGRTCWKKSLKALNCNIIQLQIPPGIPQKGRAPTFPRPMPSKPSDLRHQIRLGPCQKTRNICSERGIREKLTSFLSFNFWEATSSQVLLFGAGLGLSWWSPDSEGEAPLGTVAPRHRGSRAIDVLARGRARKSGANQGFGLLVTR